MLSKQEAMGFAYLGTSKSFDVVFVAHLSHKLKS